MKNIPSYFVLFFFMISSLLLSCSNRTQKVKDKITGRLKHAEKKWIFLQQITEEGSKTIDSVLTEKDGSFSLRNPGTNDPDYYLLRTNESNVIYLVLKKGENVEITGDAEMLEPTYSVKGSKDSELLMKLRGFDRNLSDSLNKAFVDFRKADPAHADSAGKSMQLYYTITMEMFAKYLISHNLSSIVSLSATKFINQQGELPLLIALEDSLTAAYPQNKFVQDYKSLMVGMKKLPTGSVVPEITGQTPDGKMISLSSFRGKIVLIDFWASWCGPCRRELPSVVELYNKYKGKNFEILGVSLDENPAAWKNAIEAEHLTWPQVSELKKWESKVVKDYAVDAIPYSILIDQEGKVIAKGLRVDDLDVKLMDLLRKNS